MNLLTTLARRIAKQGALSVAEYMELALTHPKQGYYMRKDPFGVAGDFTTAPEISQIFGELLGLWVVHQWLMQGSPQADLVELGPGRGTLMSDCLRATKNIPRFHDAIRVHLVEISPHLRQMQWQQLGGKHPELFWHETMDTLPTDRPIFFIANEFFDALPLRQWIWRDDQWLERKISMDAADQLYWIEEKTEDTPDISPDMALPPGQVVEQSDAARALMKQMASRVAAQGGAALAVDYGYKRGVRGDTFQAVRNHQYADPLRDPGSADLTAHVDFHALAAAAHASGCDCFGPIEQGWFLSALGAGVRAAHLVKRADDEGKSAILSGLERLLSADQMGSLFKVLAVVPPHCPTPDGFSDADRFNP